MKNKQKLLKLFATLLVLAMIITTMPVSAMSADAENPFASLEIKDMFITEGTLTSPNGQYDIFTYMEPTITLKDGTVIEQTMPGDFKIGDEWYMIYTNATPLQNAEPWTAGNTYTVTATLLDITETFEVTILPSPVVSLNVEDISIIEGSNGNNNEGAFVYDLNSLLKGTVSLSDGTVKTFTGNSVEIDGNWYSINTNEYDLQWGKGFWKSGNTYTVTATLMGVSTTFDVTITGIQVKSIVIEDISIIENTSGYHNGSFYQYYASNNIKGTVTLNDGTVKELNGSSLNFDGYWCYVSTNESELQYNDPWKAGNTYTVTAKFKGVSTTFNVTITPLPVVNLNVEDISIIEGSNGNNNEGAFVYDLNSLLKGTVSLSDGTVKTFTGNSVEIDGNWYSINTNEYDLQWGKGFWKSGNTYTVTATLMGVSTTFDVIITPSPVKSIEIGDITIIEYTNGYDNGSFYQYYASNNIKGTVTLNDGTVKELNGSGLSLYDNWYSASTNEYELQYSDPWKVGNTYTVTVTLLGVSTTFDVTITPSPVKSIEIGDITIIEYTNGYDNGAFYQYDIISLKGTATLNDGTVKVFNSNFQFGGGWYYINTNAYQMQMDEPWEVGNTYTVTATLMGVSDTFNVTIIESPVASIEIEDMSIIEGSNGHDNGSFWHYEIYCNATVTFKDGTVKELLKGNSLELDGSWYSIRTNVSDIQYNDPWTVGNTYTVTGTLLGASDSFKVTVVPSPIESITLNDIILYEGIDSFFIGNYDYYSFNSKLTEVLMKDGSFATLDDNGNRIVYEGEYYYVSNNSDRLQNISHWMPGNTYEVTGTVLGVSKTFNVTILENPVESFEFVKLPDKTEYLAGESLNLKGAIIRINYNDNDYEDVIINEDCTSAYWRYHVSAKINRCSAIHISDMYLTAGQQFAVADFYGKTSYVPVTVKDNPMESISIKENADKSLNITVYNSDNTSYDMKVLDLANVGISPSGEFSASMLTDKGAYDVSIYADDDSFALELNIGNKVFKSNIINTSDWFNVSIKLDEWNGLAKYKYRDMTKIYDGIFTADNIDIAIEYAGNHDDLWNDEGRKLGIHLVDGWDFWLFSGDDVREVVKKCFAVDDIDLTLSKYYDPVTDTYKYDYPRMGGDVVKYCPDQISYSDGVWTAAGTMNSTNMGQKCPIRLTLNDDLQITSFYINDTESSEAPTEITSSVHTIGEGTISKITAGTSVAELLAGLNEGTSCIVYKDDSIMSNDAVVGTGMVVKLTDGNTVIATYSVIVTGDVTGDGKINAHDLLNIKKHMMENTTLEDVYEIAGDVDGSDSISAFDFIYLKKYICGKDSIVIK